MITGIRSWYLRDVLELVERGGAMGKLLERTPQRLHVHLNLAALRAAGPTGVLSLDDGEELLLGIDAALGDGSGRVLESFGLELGTRTLAQGSGVVVPGDLMATIARMRAPLERPFVGVPLLYQLLSTSAGFVLHVSVPGRSRCARILRPLSIGAILAAQRFSRGADDESLKLEADVVGDRVTVHAHYRSVTADEPATPPRKRQRATQRPARATTAPNLSEQVERILGRSPTEPPASPRARRTNPEEVVVAAPSRGDTSPEVRLRRQASIRPIGDPERDPER